MFNKLFLSVFTGFATLTASATTLLFIGDSITDGNWGTPSGYPCQSEQRALWDKNHILGHGFVEMTAGKLMSQGPGAGWMVLNRGISGNTLADVITRWEKDVIALEPDMVSLLVGTNDVHYYLDGDKSKPFSMDGFEQRLDSLVCANLGKIPRLVLCTPFVAEVGATGERSDYAERKSLVDELAVRIRNVAERRNLELVDFNKLVGSLTEGNENASYWVWDGIHPTTACHYLMSEFWLENVLNKINDEHN